MTNQELPVQERMRTLAYMMRRGLAPTCPTREGWAEQLEAMANEVDALAAAFAFQCSNEHFNSCA